jgi:hypothetical protein
VVPLLRLEPVDKRSGKPSSSLRRKERTQEPARRRGGELHLATWTQQDNPACFVFRRPFERLHCGCEQATVFGGAPKPGEVRRQELEDEPVARREVASGLPIEHERLRMPRRRLEANLEFVCDAPWLEELIVEAVSAQLTLRDHIREPQSAEASILSPSLANRMLVHELPMVVVNVYGLIVLVAGARQVDQRTPVDVVDLGIGDPVGLDQAPELNEQFPSEGPVAAEVVGLGHEPKHLLCVAVRDRRHA